MPSRIIGDVHRTVVRVVAERGMERACAMDDPAIRSEAVLIQCTRTVRAARSCAA
jgi:hypothetical protein